MTLGRAKITTVLWLVTTALLGFLLQVPANAEFTIGFLNQNSSTNLTVLEGDVDKVIEICVGVTSTEPANETLVEIMVLSGTADKDVDFKFQEINLTIAMDTPMDMGQCFNVTILGDMSLEENETIMFVLDTDDSTLLDMSATAIYIIIANDDSVNVSLDPTLNVMEEDAGSENICVTLMASANTGRPFIVELTTVGGTAVDAEDYLENSSVLVFPTNSANNDTKCITMNIIDDSILEPLQSFSVVLTTSDSDVVIQNGQLMINIMDNDYVEVQVPMAIIVNEDSGVARVCVSLLSTFPTQREFSVELTAREDGSALAGEDFVEITNQTLTFSNSSSNGTELCSNITIIDDMTFESNETFMVTLSSSDPDVRLLNNASVITIVEDRDVVNVTLGISATTVSENVISTAVCVILSAVRNTEKEFSVNLVTEAGTAIGGEDYVENSTTITFPVDSPNNDQKCINITILDDLILEPNQNFYILLNSSDPDVNIQNGRLEVNIMDNDDVDILFAAALTVFEDAGMIEVCVALSNNSQTQREFTVELSTMDTGYAQAGEDYIGTNATMLTFPNSSNSGSESCLNITIINDMAVESNETFSVILSTSDPNVRLQNNVSVITIVDAGDMVSVSFGSSAITVGEDSNSTSVCVVLSAIDSTQRELSVQVTTEDDTAIGGEDYTENSTTLLFPTNSSNNTQLCFNIDIIDDFILEPNQTFSAMLTANDSDVAIQNGRFKITIIDNDYVEVTFLAALSVQEDAGAIEVCVGLSSNSQSQREFEVDLNTMNGSAIAGEDYIGIDTMLTFPNPSNSGSKSCVNITIINDMVVESNETFSAILSTSDPNVRLQNNVSVITIVDAGDNATIGFEDEDIITNERNGSVVFVIAVLEGSIGTDVTLSIDTSGATAIPDVDFASLSDNFTLSKSQSRITFTVAILNDSLPESSENFTAQLQLLSSTNGITLSPSKSIVTIGGAFVSLDVQQAMVDATLNDDINLTCTISYESGAALMAANTSLQWSTGLEVATDQQVSVTNQQQFLTTLILASVDSRYCGTYTCTAIDNFVAQASTDTTTVSIVPVISDSPVDISVPINTEAVFTCIVLVRNISEMLQISWSGPVTNLPAPELEVHPPLSQSYMSILTVNLTDSSLEGEYNCTASYLNCSTSVTSTSANLTILLPPAINQGPADVDVVSVGDSVSFNCSSTSHGNVSIMWTGPQTSLPSVTMISDIGVTSVLNLNITDTSFGGTYTCIAMNEAGNAVSNATILFITPEVTSNTSLADAGATILLTCNRQSQPQHDLQWEKLNNNAYEVILGESSENLIIPVNFSSGGNYRCVVNFTDFEAISSLPILITVSPSVLSSPASVNSTIGSTVLLTCEGQGGPNNSLSWMRQGMEIATTSSLTVAVNSSTDGGEYACVISNAAGSDNSTSEINVVPSITTDPSSKNVSLNGNVTLTCEAVGFPIPYILWFHNDSEAVDSQVISVPVVNIRAVTSTLTIVMAMVNDSGNYFCQALSSAGSMTSQVARVLVQNTPERPQMLQVISRTSRTVNLTWVEPHDNNAPIEEYLVEFTHPEFAVGERNQSVTTTIEEAFIENLFPGVTYFFTITALNSIGRSLTSVPLEVRTLDETPTSPPLNVTVTDFTSTTISISWQDVPLQNKNGDTTAFEVSYVPLENFNGAIGALMLNVSGSNFSVIIEMLEENVNYSISIRAYTSAGEGPPSQEIYATTLEGTPSSPPTNVSAMSTSPTSILVTWNEVPAIDQNGIITMYEVMYTPLTTFGGQISANTTNVSVSELMVTLPYLQEYVNYSISVRAYTSVGPGNGSEAIIELTLQAAPASPPSNVSAMSTLPTSILVTWNEVPAIDQNGIITVYEVMYTPLTTFGGQISTNTTNVSGSELMVTLSYLQEYVNYSISVRAYTSAGQGPESTVIELTQEAAPASPPTTVSAMSTSPTLIEVMWNEVPAIDQNGIITMYEVMYTPQNTFGGLISANTTNVSGSELMVTLSYLQEFVNYSISVRAYTSAGQGPESTVIELTQEAAPASPPTNVSAMSTSPTLIEVAWDEVPAIDQNGIITMYEVMYTPQNTFGGQISANTTNVSGSELMVTLSYLQEFVNYSISVRAYTSVGPGTESDAVIELTPQAAPASPPANISAMSTSPTLIEVTWNEVPAIDQNGIITMYEVMYTPQNTFGGQISANTTNVFGSELMVTLSYLQEFVNYSISVRAYTSAGQGPESTVFELTQQAAPASPPANVSTLSTSPTSILVTWNEVPAIDRNGIVTTHEVMYTPLNTFGEQISANTTNVSGSELMVTLSYLQEFVNYSISVRAYTSAGQGPESIVFELTQQAAPASPPTNVSAMSTSPTSVEVIWNEVPAIDQNGIITMYEVMYTPLNTFGGQISANTTNVSGSELIVTLSYLQEFVNYSISVRAYTSAGQGPEITVIELTQETAPSSPPTNVSAMSASPTSIDIMWNEVPAIDQNGIITMYEVMYTPQNTFGGQISANTTNVSGSELMVTLSYLQEFVNYSISVRAYTSAGQGPESTVFELTQEAVPSSTPVNLSVVATSSTNISVMWEEIPPLDQNGVIISYEVMYAPMQTFNNTIGPNATNVSGTESSIVLTALQEFVSYTVSVRAFTEVGPGNSSEGTAQTLEDRPNGSPAILEANSTSTTSINVQWEMVPLILRNGIITNYSIILKPYVTANQSTVEHVTTELNATVGDLIPHTLYNITVAALTRIGRGPPSTPVEMVMTPQDSPGPVSQPMEVAPATITATSAFITWMAPPMPNGVIESYTINLRVLVVNINASSNGRKKRQALSPINPACIEGGLNGANRNISVEPTQTSLTLTNLSSFATYEFSVSATTTVGEGDFSIPQIFSTQPSNPTAVENLVATALSANSIGITWNMPLCPNGNIVRYLLYFRQYDNVQQTPTISSMGYNNMSQTVTMADIGDLLPFTNYVVHVQAVVLAQDGQQLFGDIDLEVIVTTFGAIDEDFTDPPSTIGSPSRSQVQYDITDPLLIQTGRVILCAVVVVRGQVSPDTDLTIYNNAGPHDNSATFYITAAWGENEIYDNQVPPVIIIGDNTQYTTTSSNSETRTFTNAPLRASTYYSFFTRYDIRNEANMNQPLQMFSRVDQARTGLPYNTAGLAVGIIIILAVLIAIIIVAILVVYRYRSRFRFYAVNRKLGYDMSADPAGTFVSMDQVIANPASSIPPQPIGLKDPIPISEFKNHLRTMHSNDDYLFSEEYSNVEPPNYRPATEATHTPFNAAKNRYANIPCYDHSRVLLSVIPGRNGSDYINGNYIDGFKSPKSFIATQGPVPDTVADFWRLVWEHNILVIVMVTNLEERGRLKCHQYWPSERTTVYENIRVQLQEELVLADYTIRTLSIQCDQEKTERIITQFHFTVWPDHGVPEHPTSLLQFVRRVMAAGNPDSGPTLVHCSAGVGRTGTFITLYTQLQRIHEERNVDIFNFVRSMRYNRCCMVQTEPQYIFIHDALLEAIQCGVTDVQARDLRDRFRALGMVDAYVGLTELEIEYDKLETTVQRRSTKNFGTLKVNKPKNRYANIETIPYDNTRIRLTFIPGIEGSDYINANYMDGYLNRKAYIATQGPLPDTADDFWRMIWEQKCATIVMLTRLHENGRVKCHNYWPDTGAALFGHYQVILHNETNFPDYILREFKIVDTKDGSSLPVRQFHSSFWPEEGVPDSSYGLIDLIGQVQKWQMNSGNKPIVVHCSGGAGRSGTFIAVSILLERLKTEGVVDVFHTVRALRLQRPGMVQTVDQYELCYKAVLEYLDSFELYDNFK